MALCFALLCRPAHAENPVFTSPLPTGVRLDSVGDVVELGSMPLNIVTARSGDKAVVVLSGWREQGIQVVDLKTRQVTQTLLQDGAFYGAAFSPDGHMLYVSGGNTDMLFVYTWKDGAATLANKFELAKAKTADGTGTSYPAGVAVAPNGKFVYVAENVGDQLAVVNAATGEIAQRFPTDHYPYGVVLTATASVFVSAWGGRTVSEFRDFGGRKTRLHWPYRSRAASISVGRKRHEPLCHARREAIALRSSTRSSRKVTGYLHDTAPGAPPEGSTPNASLSVPMAEASVRRRSRQQRRRSLRSGERQVAGAQSRLTGIPTAIAEVGWRNAGPLWQRPRHPCQSGWPGSAHQLAERKADGLYAWAIEWQPARAAIRDERDATERASRQRVVAANNWQHKPTRATYPPFHHVIYIIKENRTYDQVLGDMKEGDGDAEPRVFPDITITPNHHALARRFGLFDRFFVNAESVRKDTSGLPPPT